MSSRFLTQKRIISTPRAYLYGLAGEFLVLGLGAGLTFLCFGSIYWAVLLLVAWLVGIAFPSVLKGARADRIFLVFFLSILFCLAFSFALDNVFFSLIFTTKYVKSHLEFFYMAKKTVTLLFILLTCP